MRNKWTIETLRLEALKYETRSAFKAGSEIEILHIKAKWLINKKFCIDKCFEFLKV